jgi:hypothetical protein
MTDLIQYRYRNHRQWNVCDSHWTFLMKTVNSIWRDRRRRRRRRHRIDVAREMSTTIAVRRQSREQYCWMPTTFGTIFSFAIR